MTGGDGNAANARSRRALLQRFALGRLLGKGGFGDVYEAEDLRDGGRVALKILRDAQPDWLDRFKREFRALQGLHHRNLVALDELFFDEETDRWFFTMELLDGVDLTRHVCASRPAVPMESASRSVSAPGTAEPLPSLEGASARGGATASSFDESKLRDALRQLLEGIAVLHAAGKVHRDIKPSNVMVTRQGRVVLLDFGLATEISGSSTTSALVGTPLYMAPEQARLTGEVGPAADLYSVGVILYELLTARMPFEGRALQCILIGKQTHKPGPPASLVTGVPEDLDALCMRLLQLDPALRPSAADALNSFTPGAASAAAPARAAIVTTFVGRTAELEQLDAAFAASAQGTLAMVLVCGESGLGKSSLVRHFTRQLAIDHPHATLFEGRCYERESVPYKAIDAVVDALSRRLSRLPETDVAALLPTRSAALARVFPVMLRVRPIAAEHARFVFSIDPLELRQRAFLALRELLTRIALRGPTVIVIDDLQWADEDGLRAIAEILRPPDPPPLLFIGTVRTGPGSGTVSGERLREIAFGGGRVLELSRLSHDEARALAARLLGREEAPDDGRIASESNGHPLFVEELARYVASGKAGPDRVKLDDAIWSRIENLKGKDREVAEVVAVAGKPVPQDVAAAAADVEPAEFRRVAAVLRSSNLVRTSGARWADSIEPYHDRVREAALTRLAPGRRREIHEALAVALEASSSCDPEVLATHWHDAGNRSRAASCARLAGDQASRACAFERAAHWYEQALQLLPKPDPNRRELHIKLGDALANAGRGALAAPYFKAAAEESPPSQELMLRRRAAEQLLRTGAFEQGMEASRAVLSAMGLGLPATRFGAIGTIVLYRVVLALRGLHFGARSENEIGQEDLARIDTCWSIGYALTFVDIFLGEVLVLRALLLALRAGELERISRCVSMHVIRTAAAGGRTWRRTARLREHARELADRSGSLGARWFYAVAMGQSDSLNGRFREAAGHLDEALRMTQDASAGLVWERISTTLVLLKVLEMLGRFKDLRRTQDEGLRDALARGDIWATITMRLACLRWFIDDRPDLAEMNLAAGTQQWSARWFHIQRYSSLLAQTRTKLYMGRVAEAYRLGTEVGRMRWSPLGQLQQIRVEIWTVRGGLALAAAQRGLGDRVELLREVARTARALEREGVDWAKGFAMAQRGGIALQTGNRAAAIQCLAESARAFDAADMEGYAVTVRDRAARLRDDASSAPEVALAAEFFESEGVVSPQRMMAMLLPGLEDSR
jgi:RIO-like serine/threonine protein kinase/tetratricopeptide (TPR) repeat protein